MGVLPAGTKMRVSLQWQEAHASEYARPGEIPTANRWPTCVWWS